MIRKQIHYFQDDMPENIGYGGVNSNGLSKPLTTYLLCILLGLCVL